VGLKAADGCVILLPIAIKDGKGTEVGDDVIHRSGKAFICWASASFGCHLSAFNWYHWPSIGGSGSPAAHAARVEKMIKASIFIVYGLL
jgi:hypothetical protein